MPIPFPSTRWRSPGGDGPTYRSMFAVDIAGFGMREDPDVQQGLREAINEIVPAACQETGIDWNGCHTEDRGDGLLAVTGPGVDAPRLIDPLARLIRAGLIRHNKKASRESRIQLRLAVHAGYVYFDGKGVYGSDVILLFRLLDALTFKQRLADSDAVLATLASDELYRKVLRHGVRDIAGEDFEPILVTEKEIDGEAWLWIPANSGSARRSPHPGLPPGTVPGPVSVTTAPTAMRLDVPPQRRPEEITGPAPGDTGGQDCL